MFSYIMALPCLYSQITDSFDYWTSKFYSEIVMLMHLLQFTFVSLYGDTTKFRALVCVSGDAARF